MSAERLDQEDIDNTMRNNWNYLYGIQPRFGEITRLLRECNRARESEERLTLRVAELERALTEITPPPPGDHHV